MNTHTPITNALTAFATWLRFNGARTATVNTHLARLRQFVAQAGVATLDDITPALVAAWLTDQAEQQTQYSAHPSRTAVARPLSPVTIQARLLSLRYFLRTCEAQGLLPADPLRRLPARKQAAPARRQNKMMSQTTAVALLHHARQAAQTGELIAIRDHALLAFMLDTGVRVGEAVSVRLSDVDLDQHSAAVQGKTGARVVAFSPGCTAALRAWLEVHPGGHMGHAPTWLFVGLGNRAYGRRLSENAARIAFKKLAAAAGVSGPVNPHSIRHLVGQRWVDQANPRLAQEKLGHADIKTTLGFYYRPDREKLAAETERLSLLPADE